MKYKLSLIIVLVFSSLSAAADPVSDFSLPDLEGNQHTLDGYRGKWIIINYWATNCAPCLKEIPELESFHRRHQDKDAVVLGVNYEDIKLSWLKDFVLSVKMSYPVLLAEENSVTPFGSIIMLPTTVIVSPDGHLMGLHRGAVTVEMLDKYIEQQQASASGGA
jgi:thiol-disulfide isomerase/thioredoxin